jgi:hypothetical protein
MFSRIRHLQVCNEKKRLEASYDRLRAMYNHAAAELAYFHEKELLVSILLVI